jgi:hypothetical protein
MNQYVSPQPNDSGPYDFGYDVDANEWLAIVRIRFFNTPAIEVIQNTPPLKFPGIEKALTEHNTYQNN